MVRRVSCSLILKMNLITYAAAAQCGSVRVTACQVNLCVRFLRNCSIWSKDQFKKFLTKEGKKPKEILKRMVTVYGESAPSYYKEKFWSKQFKWGRDSIEDDPHTGHPVEVTSEEMCPKLESLI